MAKAEICNLHMSLYHATSELPIPYWKDHSDVNLYNGHMYMAAKDSESHMCMAGP